MSLLRTSNFAYICSSLGRDSTRDLLQVVNEVFSRGERDLRQHIVYEAIVKAAKEGRLREPFTSSEFRRECPGFGAGTYNAFSWKHRKGNPGGASELFEKVSPGKFIVLKTFNLDLAHEKS